MATAQHQQEGGNRMKCIDCGKTMLYMAMPTRSAWGEGPKVEVWVPGHKCCYCNYGMLSPMAARVVQDVAYHALTGEWR